MISLATTQTELKTLKTAYNGAGDVTVEVCKLLNIEPPAPSTVNFIEVALKALLPGLDSQLVKGKEAVRRFALSIDERSK